MKKIKDKYESSVFENLNRENFNKIVDFLVKEKCDFIDDLFCDYLDLFNFEYDEFVEKYYRLNEKYNGEYLKKSSEDMNLLEEFYSI